MEGDLHGGAELNEASIALSFGVSRGPVREALNRLSAEGHIELRPHRGAVVTELKAKDYFDAYAVREALEVMAVRLAVPNLTSNDLEELQGLLDNMSVAAEKGEIAEFFESNVAFHGLFVIRANNSRLAGIHTAATEAMSRMRWGSLRLRASIPELIEEHQRILDAAKDGDADTAARVTQEHISAAVVSLRASESESRGDSPETGGVDLLKGTAPGRLLPQR